MNCTSVRSPESSLQRALDLIGDTLVILDAAAETVSPHAATAGKVAGVLCGLETYVSGQSDLIIDYATVRRNDEPISTATTESTVQRLLHRRMSANQQMRWSPRGAHLIVKVRTAVVNGTFNTDHTTAERWAGPSPVSPCCMSPSQVMDGLSCTPCDFENGVRDRHSLKDIDARPTSEMG